MADEGIAVLDFLDDLRRDGAASGDVAHELRDVIDGVGRAVGEQEDGGLEGGGHELKLKGVFTPEPQRNIRLWELGALGS
jgi:hypothetical protein